jgi:hypothetical protein
MRRVDVVAVGRAIRDFKSEWGGGYSQSVVTLKGGLWPNAGAGRMSMVSPEKTATL